VLNHIADMASDQERYTTRLGRLYSYCIPTQWGILRSILSLVPMLHAALDTDMIRAGKTGADFLGAFVAASPRTTNGLTASTFNVQRREKRQSGRLLRHLQF
jgi:hypothetical protein